jgi:GT2 family glycosyltransferase
VSAADPAAAPPVVAAVVVHEPGAWFDEVVASLGAQDYPNLRCLFLVNGDPTGVAERIAALLPAGVVRTVPGNPGFGPTANEVLRLVEGDSGFFCIMHDDVALEPDAIRVLVEELYRSNAGIVAPKLVDWDRPHVLQHVGFEVDRFGEIDPLVEPGEVDQEQHDAIRDVFCVPSACMLVRADLFRAMGGFPPTYDFHGEDLDVCWRAHLSGARVLVVPPARARHRRELSSRRPDLPHDTLRARHRMLTVATLSGRWRTPVVLLETALLTVVEIVVGLFTGRLREGVSSLRGLLGLLPRLGSVIARRRHVRALRRVPHHEIAGLQVRGSARLRRFLRHRSASTSTADEVRREWMPRTTVSTVAAWVVVAALVVFGSRRFIRSGVPTVGEFLPFPSSPREMFRSYLSGWWPHGAGQSAPVPTAEALVGVATAVGLSRAGLVQTVCVVGLLFAGLVGMWRLARVTGSTRGRIGAFVVYAAIPLPYGAVSAGRWSVLLTWAAVPWAVEFLRAVAGIVPGTALFDTDGNEITDGHHALPRAVLVRRGAALVFLLAVVGAFVPVFPVMAVAIAVVLAVAAWAMRGAATNLVMIPAAIVAAMAAGVLNAPWLASLASGGWSSIVGADTRGDVHLGLLKVASFDVGATLLTPLVLAFYGVLAAAAAITRGWRLTWVARAAGLVVVFGVLAVMADHGVAARVLPDPALLLAPAAAGLALAAGCVLAAFTTEVRAATISYRQPVAVLATVGLVVGCVPGAFAALDGAWRAPTFGLPELLRQLPTQEAGDYRVLFVGDPAVLPIESLPYRDGVAYALGDGPALTVSQWWRTGGSEADDVVRTALDAIAEGTTARAGRLLGPLAVRFVVVPMVDKLVSTDADPRPAPAGLLDALGDQLDLRRADSSDDLVVFENTQWMPVRSLLAAGAADVSAEAGEGALARADLSGSVPVFLGATSSATATSPIGAGTFHLAVPYDERWTLTVDGTEVAPRRAFGYSMAFDVSRAGTASLAYDTPGARRVLVAIQALLWAACVVLMFEHGGLQRWRQRRAARAAVGGAPVLDLDALGAGAVERSEVP